MKELLIGLLDNVGIACWVEIITEVPSCTYYFGPFLTRKEAELAQSGYIEDLETEGAQGIRATVKRCKPSQLTIFDDVEEPEFKPQPSWSGQA
ncbi:MAG: DUF1816 domain-containing protein [Cyanophyceae cyanobacterium]